MIEIRDSRENILGELQATDYEQFVAHGITPKKTHWDICNQVIDKYDEGLLSNREASKLMEILNQRNKHYRPTAYREHGNDLYEWSVEADAYLYFGGNTLSNRQKILKRMGGYYV